MSLKRTKSDTIDALMRKRATPDPLSHYYMRRILTKPSYILSIPSEALEQSYYLQAAERDARIACWTPQKYMSDEKFCILLLIKNAHVLYYLSTAHLSTKLVNCGIELLRSSNKAIETMTALFRDFGSYFSLIVQRDLFNYTLFLGAIGSYEQDRARVAHALMFNKM
jgi:hypothetical protein